MADSDSIAATIEQMNWEKADHDDFMKALNQSLLIQTPLQVLLEMMFKRMSTQSKEVDVFKEKLEFIEKSSIDVASILERVQSLEGNMKELSDSKLSPFTQADILERLDKAEFTAKNAMKRVTGAMEDSDQVQGPRISRMERQLKGVENLPGRLMAVDEIAEELGIQIPNTEFEWEDETQQSFGVPQSRSNRLGLLQKKVVEVEKENGVMKGTIKNLHKEIEGLKTSLGRAQENSAALLSGIEDKNKEVRRQMSQELLAAKREMSPTEGTSYSDFVKVMSQMEELRRDATYSAKEVENLKNKDIYSLQENVEALAHQVQSSAGALERETHMQKTLKKLERDMEITKKRVQNAMSAALAGGDGGSLAGKAWDVILCRREMKNHCENRLTPTHFAGVARQADLDEIVEELGKKPSKEELQKIVSKAVDVALDSGGAVPSNTDPNYSGRALKFR
ncbi:hypothetical protein BSKO_04219 [Bryopsis sp. KO-2023]|nr:hypothetical protein BSKO_04219 [Bryopsis sp. KO-2023]